MKIRTGFVANSSSSSFIIGFKDFNDLKLPKEVPEWIALLVKKCTDSILEPSDNYYEESAKIVKSEEELQEYFLDQYAYPKVSFSEWIESDTDYPGYYKEDYEELLSYIKEGYLIVFREVDHNNHYMSELLKSLPKKKDNPGIFLIKSEY